jgi:hypothetical protein
MKITKREEVCGICTSSIWWIPTITYLIFKILGLVNPEREWEWWVGIPTMFLIWGLINWKIKKNKV